MTVRLSLSVQYEAAAPQLPRWRLRRWVQRAIDTAAARSTNNTSPRAKSHDIRAATLTLRLVAAREGRELNRQFRGRDYATNVLTFEYGIDANGSLGGDIVLCMPVLRREAREQHKTLQDHAAHLTVHGVLHAVGYDHIRRHEATEMESLEILILEKLGINNPYQEQQSRDSTNLRRANSRKKA